jgi:hypothetical protein
MSETWSEKRVEDQALDCTCMQRAERSEGRKVSLKGQSEAGGGADRKRREEERKRQCIRRIMGYDREEISKLGQY